MPDTSKRSWPVALLLRPRSSGVEVHDRLRTGSRNHRAYIRAASRLVARIAIFEQVLVLRGKLLAVFHGDNGLHLGQAARVNAVKDIFHVHRSAVGSFRRGI